MYRKYTRQTIEQPNKQKKKNAVCCQRIGISEKKQYCYQEMLNSQNTLLLLGNGKFFEKHAATTGNSGTRNTATTVLLQENWNFQDNVLLLGNWQFQEKTCCYQEIRDSQKNILLLGNFKFLEKHTATRKWEFPRECAVTRKWKIHRKTCCQQNIENFQRKSKICARKKTKY